MSAELKSRAVACVVQAVEVQDEDGRQVELGMLCAWQ